MKTNIYALRGSLENYSLATITARSDAEAVKRSLVLMPSFAVNLNSSQLLHIGILDDETLNIESVIPRVVAWSTVDYETQLPDVLVNTMKNKGVISSDKKMIDASTVQQAFDNLSARLDNIEHKGD